MAASRKSEILTSIVGFAKLTRYGLNDPELLHNFDFVSKSCNRAVNVSALSGPHLVCPCDREATKKIGILHTCSGCAAESLGLT